MIRCGLAIAEWLMCCQRPKRTFSVSRFFSSLSASHLFWSLLNNWFFFKGLLETDSSRLYMGNRDVIQWMAEDMNMYYDYGPSTRNHTWGFSLLFHFHFHFHFFFFSYLISFSQSCAIISRFPIKKSVHLLLPSPQGELACGIHATLDVYGEEVDFLISHNGNEDHHIDRLLQTQELSYIMGNATNPILYAGWVISNPLVKKKQLEERQDKTRLKKRKEINKQ